MATQRRTKGAENYEDVQPPISAKKESSLSGKDPHWPKLIQSLGTFVSHLPKQSYFFAECIVTNVVVLWLFVLLIPLAVAYNILKFLEAKWVYYHTGGEPMSGQDALWLQDTKENRLIIHSVMVFREDDVTTLLDGIKGIIKRCLSMKNKDGEVVFPRLEKCIVRGTFQYFLEKSANFDVNQHVYEYQGESPKSYEEMQQLLSKLSSEDLPFDIPAWRFIVIRQAYDENKILLLFRAHHGLADGISLTKFLLLIFPDQNLIEGRVLKFSNVDRLLMSIKSFLLGGRLLAHKLFGQADTSIIHSTRLSGIKKVAWSKPIELSLIKQIKNKTKTTVNDVMMACISLSFRDYFLSKGVDNVPDITASIPVDVRPPDMNIKLENNFAIVSLKLPVSKLTVFDQLYATKARMDVIKHSGEALFMCGAANVTVQNLPEVVTNIWNKPIANKTSLVVSNVPGPPNPFTIANNAVKEIFFWPPQRDQVGIGVGIYSYAGKVSIGVIGDENCLPDPQAIVDGFRKKLVELDECVNKCHSDSDSGVYLK